MTDAVDRRYDEAVQVLLNMWGLRLDSIRMVLDAIDFRPLLEIEEAARNYPIRPCDIARINTRKYPSGYCGKCTGCLLRAALAARATDTRSLTTTTANPLKWNGSAVVVMPERIDEMPSSDYRQEAIERGLKTFVQYGDEDLSQMVGQIIDASGLLDRIAELETENERLLLREQETISWKLACTQLRAELEAADMLAKELSVICDAALALAQSADTPQKTG